MFLHLDQSNCGRNLVQNKAFLFKKWFVLDRNYNQFHLFYNPVFELFGFWGVDTDFHKGDGGRKLNTYFLNGPKEHSWINTVNASESQASEKVHFLLRPSIF